MPTSATRDEKVANVRDKCDWVHFAEHPPVRRFPADGSESPWIQLDIRWTRWLAGAIPGNFPVLPGIIFAFGHACGVPLIALCGLCPMCFAWPSTHQPPVSWSSLPYVGIYAASMTVMWLMVYFMGRKKVLGLSYVFVPCFLGTAGLMWYIGRSHGDDYHTPFDMYCLFLIGWSWSSVLAFLGKTFFLRLRPAAAYAQSSTKKGLTSGVKNSGVHKSKTWSTFTAMHAEGKNMHHSFPSFDAACAGCLVATVWVAEFTYEIRRYALSNSGNGAGNDDKPDLNIEEGQWKDGLLDVVITSLTNVPILLWLGLLLAMYGRVYFLAHHILDVLCGAITGFVMTAFAGLALRLEVASGIWQLGSFFGAPVDMQQAFSVVQHNSASWPARIIHNTLGYILEMEVPKHPCGYAVDLVWVVVCMFAIATFFFVKNIGPFVSMGILCTAAMLLSRISWGSIAGTAIVTNIFLLQFQVQSQAHKVWVVDTLRRFYNESGTSPPSELVIKGKDGKPQFGENLISLLKDKRKEFFDQAAEEGAWPGNLYVMHQFRGSLKKGANERRKLQGKKSVLGEFYDADNDGEDRIYLVCTWHRLDYLLNKRLCHFLKVTKTKPSDYDVVVGIYSGGALLAPLLTRQLRDLRSEDDGNDAAALQVHDLCFIKVSRYKSCNMDPVSLTKVTLEVAFGSHDSKYTVSKPPSKEMIEGKRILMIDDASVSGGTFRAADEFLRNTLGAISVRGLALCDFDGKTHIYDSSLKSGDIEPQKLDVGSFTPWGTF